MALPCYRFFRSFAFSSERIDADRMVAISLCG
jgi:hypothetical protein